MDLKEYLHRMENDENFAPGWDAIDEAFAAIYGTQKPRHYATNLKTRANLGGDQYLDGYSIYDSPHGYKHIVSYGLSELYGNEASFGGEWSGWGYEMTFKLRSNSDDCLWALNLLANLAYFTNTQSSHLEPLNFILGDGSSIDRGSDSKITGLIITHDTEVKSVETLHGRVEFLQLVGITQDELEWISSFQSEEQSKQAVEELIEKMKVENPFLVTDMRRGM